MTLHEWTKVWYQLTPIDFGTVGFGPYFPVMTFGKGIRVLRVLFLKCDIYFLDKLTVSG